MLTGVLAFMMLVMLALPVFAEGAQDTGAASQGLSVDIPVEVVNGPGLIKIEGTAYLPAETQMLVTDKGTIHFDFTGAAPADKFTFDIYQVPGDDAGLIYDETVYTLLVEIFIDDYSKYAVAVLSIGDELEKPDTCKFVNEKKPDTETTEYKTITRTITYTERTPDGNEVAKPYIQTVKLKRTVTTDPYGKKTYGPWSIDEGDTDSVKSPEKEGWTPDQGIVGKWEIDLENPEDTIVHVVYLPKETPVPTKTVTPTPSPGKGGKPSTGNRTDMPLWTGILIAAGAVVALIIIVMLVRRRKN